MIGSLTVNDGGLFTTIQDGGRSGYRKYGIPVSGAMDTHSWKLANWLAGNPLDTPILEMTLKGGVYEFNSQAVIAIAGAEMKPEINGEKAPMYKTIQVQHGDKLQLGYCRKGCRSYLAIQGKWEIDKMMGSYSTYTPGVFGGLKGRVFKKGDRLQWQSAKFKGDREIDRKLIPHFASSNTLRVIKGPEFDWMNPQEQKQFLGMTYMVSAESNRMGIRLKGEEKLEVSSRQMSSSATLPGVVQLPQSGHPVILGKDGQTVGGYPRIAKVVEADMWRVGQLPPSSYVGFKLIDIEEAKALKEYQQALYRENLK
ncbi:MAG: biotin-dependent carboxyltransferase [Balneolaceae bacterium]|nr:biotin-dependent carboxyltransferase [Balneolaceae bacterium]